MNKYFYYLNKKYIVNLPFETWYYTNNIVKLPDNSYLFPLLWKDDTYPPIPIKFKLIQSPLYILNILIEDH